MPWTLAQRRAKEAERRAAIAKDRSLWRTCACGCGAPIPSIDPRGRPHRWVIGHTNRGRENPWMRKPDDQVTQWYTRAKARKILGPGQCELRRLRYCSGRIEVHHIDGNPWNNKRENLTHLCATHHQLVERGYIDRASPVMPTPYVYPNGRRIWPNNKQYPLRKEA